jgi:GTP-binding protein YchF
MKAGIIGLPKTGKTTLFNILTAAGQATDKFSVSKETHLGVATVPDRRLEQLRDLYGPKRYVPATIEYVDVPGIHKGEGAGSPDLEVLKTVDALVHVVRAFDDPELPHPDGSVDPARDVENVNLELILADHELVERRLGRLEQSKKRGLSAEEQKELALLTGTVLPALESERPLREIGLEGDDEKRLRGFQLLSAKPILLVVNVDEDGLTTPPAVAEAPGVESVVVSAPIEEEIAGLEPDDQREFLESLGLETPSLERVLRATYHLLGLISFFTVGEDEVRAWTVRSGTVARKAAGAVHSDIERGFIRAEVTPWEDLIRLGSLAACRDQGLLRLEGKEYLVRDGEVIHFRFNV